MKEIIKEVLDSMSNSQINLSSESARETISNLVSAALKSKGHYRQYPVDDKSSDTWPGLDVILTTSDSEVIESPSISRQELIEQAYREVTADGLPQGGDVEAMKLAEAIVDDMEGDYMYESNDGGVESERTYVKQLVQKYVNDGSDDNLFNDEEIENANGDMS